MRLNPKTIRNRTALLLTSLSLLISLAGCAGGGGGWTPPPPFVETSQALQRDWTIIYSTTGTLRAANKVDLNSEVAGTIHRILVKEGQAVRKGEVLMLLRADKQMAQLNQSAAGISASEGNLEQQKAEISQAQARLDSAISRKNFAQSELQRYEKLFREQFISQQELDQRRNNYDIALIASQEAEQALSSAKARYNQAYSSLAQAESNYRYNAALAGDTVIRAPFTGLVGQKYVDPGDFVAPTEKLMTVVETARYQIQFPVPERYLGDLKLGQAVKVRFEGLGGEAFPGNIDFIDPVIQPDTHTITTKALIQTSPKLKHGLFGVVSVELGLIPQAVVIPEEAIVSQGEKTFVYVVREEMPQPKQDKDQSKLNQKAEATRPVPIAHLQEVFVGYREAGQVQIRSGLKPGERVIVNGLQKVSDGIQVKLEKAGGSPPSPKSKDTKGE